MKENWFKLEVLLVIILIGISVVYYLTIFLPKKEGATQGRQAGKNQINTNAPKKLPELILGHWRNDKATLDYIFYKNNQALSVIRANDSSECTYEIQKQVEEKNYIEVWFKCPQPNWPGYAEEHVIELSKNRDSFIDTMYIQGMAQRIDGQFVKVGETDDGSKNWNY
ncbi:MAG: hypothetical protein NT170_03885 [Candidatus Moranbacteria bacterium]|nr:hypothetical protein [Candidatus Moranbacteria bacterium]